MKMILPYTSYHHMAKFYRSEANEKGSIWKNCLELIWEVGMDFSTVVNILDKGMKAYRPTWGEGEFMWKKDDILVHTTPYWGGEMINQYLDGYPYICEKRDVNACDWILTKTQD